MNPELKKGLLKWVLCVISLIANFLIFGDIGILFGVGLCFVFIKYL